MVDHEQYDIDYVSPRTKLQSQQLFMRRLLTETVRRLTGEPNAARFG
jgi:hypothetical protein